MPPWPKRLMEWSAPLLHRDQSEKMIPTCWMNMISQVESEGNTPSDTGKEPISSVWMTMSRQYFPPLKKS